MQRELAPAGAGPRPLVCSLWRGVLDWGSPSLWMLPALLAPRLPASFLGATPSTCWSLALRPLSALTG